MESKGRDFLNPFIIYFYFLIIKGYILIRVENTELFKIRIIVN